MSELGLYYYKARFYSPTLGRFLQTDPVGYESDLNLYAYVENNPINRTDPPGLFFVQAVGGAVNAGVGALVSFSLGEKITAGTLIADFLVGAASSGVVTVGRLAALTQATNTELGKVLTAGGGEVYKGVSSGKSPGDTGFLAGGAAALNATGVIGKTGAALAQKSGLMIPSNSTANAILNQAFSAPAGVGAGVALGGAVSNLGLATASAAALPANQPSSFNSGSLNIRLPKK